jgi:hypothetical protein
MMSVAAKAETAAGVSTIRACAKLRTSGSTEFCYGLQYETKR